MSPAVCSIESHRTATLCTRQSRQAVPKTDVCLVSFCEVNMLLEAWHAAKVGTEVQGLQLMANGSSRGVAYWLGLPARVGCWALLQPGVHV